MSINTPDKIESRPDKRRPPPAQTNFFCFQVLTFCPTQLGHFRSVLKISLGGDTLVIPIRVVGEASTVGAKQPR